MQIDINIIHLFREFMWSSWTSVKFCQFFFETITGYQLIICQCVIFIISY